MSHIAHLAFQLHCVASNFNFKVVAGKLSLPQSIANFFSLSLILFFLNSLRRRTA